MPRHFDAAFFSFLSDLKRHNDRDWFAANRERYVIDVEAPMLRFIADVGARLPGITGSFKADARRAGGSLYRIHRDTRFSPDKSPYKTWMAAHFRHRQAKRGQPAPGFYVHLAPGECWGGGGIYHPDQPTLTRIRERMVARGAEWDAVRASGIEIEGARLTRVPAGFDRTHRFAEDLKWKDLYTGTAFTQADATSEGFLDRYMDCCRRAAPLVEFLTKAVGLPWQRA